jgi:hypothetical protein
MYPHNLDSDTQHFYEQYDDSDDFDGVTLEELPIRTEQLRVQTRRML